MAKIEIVMHRECPWVTLTDPVTGLTVRVSISLTREDDGIEFNPRILVSGHGETSSVELPRSMLETMGRQIGVAV